MGLAAYLAGVVLDKAAGAAIDFAAKKWEEHKLKQGEREKILKEQSENDANAERVRHRLYRLGSRHQRVRDPNATGERLPPPDNSTSNGGE